MSFLRNLRPNEAAGAAVILIILSLLVIVFEMSRKSQGRWSPETITGLPAPRTPGRGTDETRPSTPASTISGLQTAVPTAGTADHSPAVPHTGVGVPLGLTVDRQDPRRFLWNGESIYLVGYYPRIGALTVDQTDYENYYRLLIDTLASHRINYFRNVFNMGQPFSEAMTVYRRTGPGRAADGGPRVDLTQLSPEYFDYWRKVIEYAAAKDMIVQLTIFDSWHNKEEIVFQGEAGRVWGMRYDYYNGANNINGINASTPEAWHDPDHPVFEVQKALIEAVVDELGHLPNLVFEISNENYVNAAWELELADYLTEYQQSKGLTPHLVMPRDLPNHDQAGGKQNMPAQAHQELYENLGLQQPLIADNDGGGHSGPNVRRRKAWAALTAGAHISYFHPDISRVDELLSEDAARGMTYLGLTRKFLDDFSIDLRGLLPCPYAASQGWCYGAPDQEYIVYLVHGGETELRGLPEDYAADWFNPRTGESQLAPGGPVFTAPDQQDWVLYVRAIPRTGPRE